MDIRHMYTGDDGETHIEEWLLEDHPELTAPIPAKSIIFKRWEPGNFLDWHAEPQRQIVIAIDGEAEIGLADGSKHRFGPGQVNIAEDTTGKGHTRLVTGNKTRVVVEIRLA